MELKEALISRYNMPLTFVGIEPEKKDLRKSYRRIQWKK